MRHYPIYMDLMDRDILVVGGHERAEPKVRLLQKAGARISVVAPRLGAEITAAAEAGQVTWIKRPFKARDLEAKALVFGATGIDAVDRVVASLSDERGLPVNVVDRPELCRFITPSIVDRDGVVVAISTGGQSPVLAQRLKALIDQMLPSRVGRLAAFADQFRETLSHRVASVPARRRFWKSFFDGPVAHAVLDGDEAGARSAMVKLVNRAGFEEEAATPAGRVALVGAGPGDPDLLTLKAHRLLGEADVIIHDSLVGPDILDYARRDADRIFVGKRKGAHAKSQDEINNLVVEEARKGHLVVRLKGGDPFLFGRGGEELDACKAAGIAVEIVPGITAALGASASLAMPLLQRDVASRLTFVTGHSKDGSLPDNLAAHAGEGATLCIYMGLTRARAIQDQLLADGLSPSLPVSIIENATRSDERVLRGRLDELGDLSEAEDRAGPALLVIGEVAAKGLEHRLDLPVTDQRFQENRLAV